MSEQRLAGYRALITGGSDGIGWAIAEAFAQQGADVWIIARDQRRLETARKRLEAMGVEARATAADLSDAQALSTVADAVGRSWDSLDTLVNNAGIARFTPFEAVDAAELQAQLNLNLVAPYLLTQALLPALKRSQRASVVQISSTSATRLIPGRPASVYAMTKGGLNSLTKALALELGPCGVRVNAIAPGTINTPLTARMIAAMSPGRRAEYDRFVRECFALGRRGDPADVASAAVYLASSEARWVTGSVLTVDGGLSTN